MSFDASQSTRLPFVLLLLGTVACGQLRETSFSSLSSDGGETPMVDLDQGEDANNSNPGQILASVGGGGSGFDNPSGSAIQCGWFGVSFNPTFPFFSMNAEDCTHVTWTNTSLVPFKARGHIMPVPPDQQMSCGYDLAACAAIVSGYAVQAANCVDYANEQFSLAQPVAGLRCQVASTQNWNQIEVFIFTHLVTGEPIQKIVAVVEKQIPTGLAQKFVTHYSQILMRPIHALEGLVVSVSSQPDFSVDAGIELVPQVLGLEE